MISSAVRILLFVHSRTVRDILADRPPLNFHTAARLKLPLANTAQHRRTVRGPLADCPQWISAVDNFSAEPLVSKSHERRTVRPLPADCPPLTRGLSAVPNFRLSRIVPTFSIPTSIWDHCSYKNPKISNIAWKPSNDLYEQVSTKNSKINRVESWKLINGSKIPQKFIKMKQEVHERTICHMC